MEATAGNPLSSLAFRTPSQTLRAASIGGRIFAAGLALLVAFDQSYDPTQVFTVVAAVTILATLAPLRGARGDSLAAVGAGAAFFAGTVLTHLEYGLGLLAMGLIAGLAGFAFAHREGRDITLPALAFLAGAFVIGALQVAIVFLFE